jgi:hypothetical protein
MITEVTYIFLNLRSVNSAINSENEEREEKLMSDATVKRPRLEYQGDWQWDKLTILTVLVKFSFLKSVAL